MEDSCVESTETVENEPIVDGNVVSETCPDVVVDNKESLDKSTVEIVVVGCSDVVEETTSLEDNSVGEVSETCPDIVVDNKVVVVEDS